MARRFDWEENKGPALAVLYLLLGWVLHGCVHVAFSAPASDTTFRLLGSSDQQIGCFGPCDCAVLMRSPMDGSFRLHLLGISPTEDDFDVLDVDWKVATENGPLRVTGSGTYQRRWNELKERMVLDLSLDGAQPLRFDSGWDTMPPNVIGTPGVWWIDVAISRQHVCFDTLFTVSAAEQGTGVGSSASRFRLVAPRPSPFRDRVDLGFVLESETRIELAIFEASGRRVRTLIPDSWQAAGPHSVPWDGTDDQGRPVPAGVLFVRLRSSAGNAGTTLVRVR